TRSKRDWSSDVCSSDLNRSQLEEVPFVDFRLRRTSVITLHAERTDNARVQACLFQNLPQHGIFRSFIYLNGPGWNLDAGNFKRNVIMGKDQQFIFAHNIAHNFANNP